jgi:DNA-binding response OmpR family regulator
MRDYVRRLLAERYEVTAVADGEAALAAAKVTRPDLVLTDVMMPRLGGFGLLERLRGDPETKTIPIILLSARAGEDARVEGLQQGADDYLVKPFSASELLARVETHLNLARVRNEAEQTLRHAQEELERRVWERTEELRQSREAAVKLMEEAIQARRDAEVLNAQLQREIAERNRSEQEREALLKKFEKSQQDLVAKIADLELFHDVAMGRELKMEKLEREVKRLQEVEHSNGGSTRRTFQDSEPP